MIPLYERHHQKNRTRAAGGVLIVFTMILMVSLLIALSMGNWINVHRKGDTLVRVDIKQATMAGSAIEDALFRLQRQSWIPTCTVGTPSSYSYYVNNSTITVTLDCYLFAP